MWITCPPGKELANAFVITQRGTFFVKSLNKKDDVMVMPLSLSNEEYFSPSSRYRLCLRLQAFPVSREEIVQKGYQKRWPWVSQRFVRDFLQNSSLYLV